MGLDHREFAARRLEPRPVATLVVLALIAALGAPALFAHHLSRIPTLPEMPAVSCTAYEVPQVCADKAPELAASPTVAEAYRGLRRALPAPPDADVDASWGDLSPSERALVYQVLRDAPAAPDAALPAELTPADATYETAVADRGRAEAYGELRQDALRRVQFQIEQDQRVLRDQHALYAADVLHSARISAFASALAALVLALAAAATAWIGGAVTVRLTPHHLELGEERLPWEQLQVLVFAPRSVSWRLRDGSGGRARVWMSDEQRDELERESRRLRAAAGTGEEDEQARRAVETLLQRS
ncbi:MAG: hypothetical protein EP330_17040 [Deltaproteobacteria bacterium]|nr:MAG: hypothetical protein EP330_17040 [Deltaproteobacteria bacterium]